MKNIHLLPTDKPSILFLNNVNKKLLIDNNGTLKNVLPSGLYHNIYITSDEEIKEGDWFYNIVSLKPEAFKACENGDGYVNCSKYSHYRIDCKKIILTTDPDLITDGVQAIDDEFLEWFVKNPTCEYVEVYEVNGKLFAEPIISQEEAKQELHICKYCGAETNQLDDECYAKPKLDLNKLESKLDNALDKETTESLNEWFDEKRNGSITLKERVIGVLRYHSIEKEEDWSRIIEERDFEELAGNLISCFEQFGKAK
jgi:hypothetical protein